MDMLLKKNLKNNGLVLINKFNRNNTDNNFKNKNNLFNHIFNHRNKIQLTYKNQSFRNLFSKNLIQHNNFQIYLIVINQVILQQNILIFKEIFQLINLILLH